MLAVNLIKKIILLFFLIIAPSAFSDAGIVKFMNHSSETFTLVNSDAKKTAQFIGIPMTIPSNSNQNYYLTLSDADVGSHYQYFSTDRKLHFSIDIKSTQTYIFHHTTKRTVDYLSVDWENILENSDIHYVLPLFWNEPSYITEQPVRVDTDNNALIGIFSQEPNNVLTIMSYNTDKDGTGTDHDPKYHDISDILNLLTSGRLPIPDVLMIQEGLGAQNLALYQQTLSQLVPGKWYGYYATEGSRSDSNIMLVHPKYNTGIQSGAFSFKEQCGWGLVGKRNAVYVDIPIADIVQTKTPGYFRIFNTHLESGRGSDIFFHAAQVRFAQFNEILHFPRTSVVELVIGGDFNTLPIFDDVTGLTKYKFDDLMSVFDQYLGDSRINWGQPITCTWGDCTQYTFQVGMWLDRLLSTALSVPGYRTYVLYPVVAHHVDGYSDHLPIWVTLYFDNY